MKNKSFKNNLNKRLVMFLTVVSMILMPLATLPTVVSSPNDNSVLDRNLLLPTEKNSIQSGPVSMAYGYDANILLGANYLINTQADITSDNAGNGADPGDPDPDDGGWDWNLASGTYTHSAAASPQNIYGETALGLYYAYRATQMNSLTPDTRYMTAMKDAANFIISTGTNPPRSASDLIFLMLYDDLPSVCGTTYQAAAKAKYDARISSYGSAQALAEWIRDDRGAYYDNGIIPWDISGFVRAAAMLDARYGGYAADADAMAEVLYQDSFMLNPGYFDAFTAGPAGDQGYDPTYTNTDYYWYTSGITGLIDSFDAVQVHTVEIPGLLTILLACQCSSGGFSYQYGGNTGDEDWQMTALAVITLGQYDPITYQSQIQAACAWLASQQDPVNGCWDYGPSYGHYPQVGGECVAALYFYGPVHNLNTKEVFWSIEAAIDDLDTVNGNTIEVQPGTYKGNIIVYKEVTIQSSGGNATTIIDASQIDICNYKNQWCKGINQAGSLGFDPGILKNGFDIWSDNVVIDGFTIINAVWPTQYSRGIGILIGSIWTTYAGFIPWNIDQWGGIIPNYDCPTPTGVIIKHNYIDGASDGIYNWASSGNIIEGNTIVNSVAVGGAGIQCYEGGTNNIIRGNVIDNCDGAGISVGGVWMPNPDDGLLDISNTKIYSNTITSCAIGIQFYNADGSGSAAYYNKILANSIGIYVGDAYGGTTVVTAYCNAIVYNANGVINNAVTGPFIAECNWWGSSSGPNGLGPGTGDSVSINIDYNPWVGKDLAEANGPYNATVNYMCISFDGSVNLGCCAAAITITSYDWEFGDGTYGTGEDPQHCYPHLGTYTANLTVTFTFLGLTSTHTDSAPISIICPSDDTTPVIDLLAPEPNTQVSDVTMIEWRAYIPANEGSDNFYVDLYYGLDTLNWRLIEEDLPNNDPNDPLHGYYLWDTTALTDGDYYILAEVWTNDHSKMNYDIVKPTFYIYNGNLEAMVSDVLIIDVSTNSKEWVKDTDTVTITAGITGATGLDKSDIVADLTGLGSNAVVPADEFDGLNAIWHLDSVVCSPSNGPITITVTVLGEDSASNTCVIVADNTKPGASLVKPVNGLYFLGVKLLPLNKLVIIGSATVQLSAQDSTSGVQKAELYLNNNLVGKTESTPYVIALNKRNMGPAQLRIDVYDNAGNIDSISQLATIFNILGN